jgi:hypothetical protein
MQTTRSLIFFPLLCSRVWFANGVGVDALACRENACAETPAGGVGGREAKLDNWTSRCSVSTQVYTPDTRGPAMRGQHFSGLYLRSVVRTGSDESSHPS